MIPNKLVPNKYDYYFALIGPSESRSGWVYPLGVVPNRQELFFYPLHFSVAIILTCVTILLSQANQRKATHKRGKTMAQFTGKIETFEGRTIPVLTYTAEFVKLEKGDTIPADEMPSADDIRDIVNNARKAAARTKAVNAALEAAGYTRKTANERLAESEDLQVATVAKVYIARGMSEADAIKQARATLGL